MAIDTNKHDQKLKEERMAEKAKSTSVEKKETVKVAETSTKDNSKKDKTETKKAETKKKIEVPKKIHTKAIANIYSAKMSSKYSFAICRMIKGRTLEKAAEMLRNVVKKKQVVKMAGLELPHQKGKGVAGGRFPKNAALEFIEVVKQLQANSSANGIENPVITIAMANKAPRPFKSGGRRAKRTHVHLEAMDRTKLKAKDKRVNK